MYFPGQVVFDRDTQEPFVISDIWDPKEYPRRHTHFLKATGEFDRKFTYLTIALPKSVEEAKELLSKGIITPAPVAVTHCWQCGNWLSNHNADGTCWERTHGN